MAKIPITINSILGGASPSRYFGAEGTFDQSVSIDPDFPIANSAIRTSGFAVPIGMTKFSSSNITGNVIAIITNPKDNLTWTIQDNGKVVIYSTALSSASETLIGTVAGSSAGGATYYNNYIYVMGTGSSFDDVSRIGPLNTLPYDGQTGNFTVGLTVTGGTSGATGVIIADVDAGATGTLTLSNISGLFVDNETITDTSTGSAAVNRTLASLITDNVWKGATLGSLTALKNTLYPTFRGMKIPNHWGYVHGDNSLYFCDFVNGQGIINRIHTMKVTNEGDTNDTTVPSAYNVLDLPFGFYPTTMTNFGTDVIILGNYSSDITTNQGNASFILWSPINSDTFYLGPVELSDPFATAVQNVNGQIYIWSGNGQNGYRLSRYVGGDATNDIALFEEGFPPFAGAVDSIGNKLIWGAWTTTPSTGSCVMAYGSKDIRLNTGVQNIIKTTSSGANPIVTALKYVQQDSNIQPKAIVAWHDGSAQGLDKYSATGTLASVLRWTFNIGQKFNIQRIRIPFGGAVAANTTITPTIYFDDLSSSQAPTVINNTNYPGSRKIIYKQPELGNYIGENNLTLEFVWTGTNPLPIAFPIKIVVDLKDDESDK